jgi:hypothetical protein
MIVEVPVLEPGAELTPEAASLVSPAEIVEVLEVALPGMEELAAIAWDAVKIFPPMLVSSILGQPWDLRLPPRRWSEYSLLSPWKPLRALRYLLNTTVPSLPFQPPPLTPPLLDDYFFQPSVILQRPDHMGSYTSFPREAWFFINGIMTNSDVAQLNAAHLTDLFYRPMTVIQNATSSLWIDLAQCAIGKQWRQVTEPVVKAMPAIYAALKSEKEKVVVVCHSQGTIIMATVLDLLYRLTAQAVQSGRPPEGVEGTMAAMAEAYAPAEFIYQSDEDLDLRDFAPLTEAELAKLEVYSFATCADVFVHYRPQRGARPPIPYIEHFGNERDIVARLGMLAPKANERGILIDGPRFMRDSAWGHLLSEHYLYPIQDVQRVGRKQGGRGGAAPFRLINRVRAGLPVTPRLYRYINGGGSDLR